MAKMDSSNDWFYKYPNDTFAIDFSFANDISSGDSLASCTATIFDSSNTDKTASMISSTTVSDPSVTFNISDGVADSSYNIKLVGTTTNGKKFTHYIQCEVFGTITLNSKLGDPNANSYVTLEQTNDFIRNKYGHTSIWDTLNTEAKKRTLIEAAQDMENFNYVGEKYYDAQALQHPRDDHDVVSGDVGTPCTLNSFRNTSLKSTTYLKFPQNHWKFSSIHITAGTPLNDIRLVSKSNVTTGSITVTENFSATPNINTDFKLFAPIDIKIRDAQCLQALYILKNSGDTSLEMYKNMNARKIKIGDVQVDFKDTGLTKISFSPEARKLLSPWIRRGLRYGRA